MGAAGYVAVYSEAKVREEYEALWGDLGYSIEGDWPYPSWDEERVEKRGWVVRMPIGDEFYLLNYFDDQGGHEGISNSFWFEGYTLPEDERAKQWAEIDERVPEGEQPWQIVGRQRDHYLGVSPAQARVLCAFRRAGTIGEVEVWT